MLYIGGNGHLRSELEKLVDSLNLQTRITFLGEVTNPGKFYQSLDFYVQPSLWEGYGLTVVEAQAHGLPTCLSNIPAFNEFKFQSHQYFDPNCVASIASTLENMAAKPALFKLTAEDGKHFMIQNSINKTAEIYKKIYNEKI